MFGMAPIHIVVAVQCRPGAGLGRMVPVVVGKEVVHESFL